MQSLIIEGFLGIGGCGERERGGNQKCIPSPLSRLAYSKTGVYWLDREGREGGGVKAAEGEIICFFKGAEREQEREPVELKRDDH